MEIMFPMLKLETNTRKKLEKNMNTSINEHFTIRLSTKIDTHENI